MAVRPAFIFAAIAAVALLVPAGSMSEEWDAATISAGPWAQAAVRVAVQANGDSTSPAISADGRFVVFESGASNLVPDDTNETSDVFVRDRVLHATRRVSVSSTGAEGNFSSLSPAVSADGRFVAYASVASTLVLGDTNGAWDVFVRDLVAGTTQRVSVSTAGAQSTGSDEFLAPAISADGRFVAYSSVASDLVAGDTNGTYDVFLRDRFAGTTKRVSVSSRGVQSNGESGTPSISADGRVVVFYSVASNLAVRADTNNAVDVYVRDLVAGTTRRVSVSSSGAQANRDSGGAEDLSQMISANGRYVVFASLASNLSARPDTNRSFDVFVRDRSARTTRRASVSWTGRQANSVSSTATISPKGRFVAFASYATNLLPRGDYNIASDIFVRDLVAHTTRRASVSSTESPARGQSSSPTVLAIHRFVAFESGAANLIAGDTNRATDIFVRDLSAGTTQRVSIA
jgi:Tol biopolymer transport system component